MVHTLILIRRSTVTGFPPSHTAEWGAATAPHSIAEVTRIRPDSTPESAINPNWPMGLRTTMNPLFDTLRATELTPTPGGPPEGIRSGGL